MVNFKDPLKMRNAYNAYALQANAHIDETILSEQRSF